MVNFIRSELLLVFVFVVTFARNMGKRNLDKKVGTRREKNYHDRRTRQREREREREGI